MKNFCKIIRVLWNILVAHFIRCVYCTFFHIITVSKFILNFYQNLLRNFFTQTWLESHWNTLYYWRQRLVGVLKFILFEFERFSLSLLCVSVCVWNMWWRMASKLSLLRFYYYFTLIVKFFFHLVTI